MKYSMLLLMLLTASASFSQTTTSKLPPVSDTFSTNLLASAASFIRLTENPKKDISFFTQDLRETSKSGQPVYAAPFPFPGFTANVQKITVYRQYGLAEWKWTARFADAPRGTKTAAIKALINKADSLLHIFDGHKKGNGVHVVNALAVNSNLDWTWMPNEFAEITITFSKPSFITEQQAYDSLINLYKPLLLQKAFAAECTEKLGNAFGIEKIPREKITSFFTGCIQEIANKDIEMAYVVMIASPSFIPPEELTRPLSSDQRAHIKSIAQKDIAEFYAKRDGGEAVATEQKKQQTEKQINQCDKIKQLHNAYMFRTGITVIGTGSNPVIGRVSAINCAGEKVSVTVPGVKGYTPDKVVQVGITEFSKWQKNHEQYYQCSRCGGEGGEEVTKTETKTKELPFGYFDGIITTVTKTKTSTYWLQCYKCKGTGWALEKDRDLWNTER